ncbi:metallophosphoesterase [Leptolyngbya sp. 'hensonii']|uniref:metallophosphoesterase n=1 Tax=Leptolyngbya sp. 'hensonii' TaxID=1922337 RepID=UPI00209B9DCE|nr:metallophosphoesterase [Leptolyngbya sp. 'hensonii']
MKQRVRWQAPAIAARGIDQTRLVLDDGQAETEAFSFLVIGDSGSGSPPDNNPQRHIADQMALHREDCRFLLHTGDVVYLVGASEFYGQNFIEPYHQFLVGGDHPERIASQRLLFSFPVLPVPGNHDYYDLHCLWSLLFQLTLPVLDLLTPRRRLDIGWHGSNQGQGYAQAFMDCLASLSTETDLEKHLDRHYTAQTDTGSCLRYQPGHFTHIPNRYYTFQYGGIDFFALDSNTFNAPIPLPDNPEGRGYRRHLQEWLVQVERQRSRLQHLSERLHSDQDKDREQLTDLQAQWQQIEELHYDITKQLAVDSSAETDWEQLDWLRQGLIRSWRSSTARGRVLYFHHPPYVTEASKWRQGQTLAVRQRLRAVLDQVALELGDRASDRPLVDLVLNGHAHCLEYLETQETGHADAHIPWIVCGGSGHSLRRQRREGARLQEIMAGRERDVAASRLFVGRSGHGEYKHRPYSFLRIDVEAGSPPRFVVRPYISDWFQHRWEDRSLPPFALNGPVLAQPGT